MRNSAVLLLLAAIAAMASAAIEIYDDMNSFLSDTGATSATGALPSIGGLSGILVAGSVTTSSPNGAGTLVIGQSSPSHFGTSLLAGNEITVVVSLARPTAEHQRCTHHLNGNLVL